jgi:hypothetical protein
MHTTTHKNNQMLSVLHVVHIIVQSIPCLVHRHWTSYLHIDPPNRWGRNQMNPLLDQVRQT